LEWRVRQVDQLFGVDEIAAVVSSISRGWLTGDPQATESLAAIQENHRLTHAVLAPPTAKPFIGKWRNTSRGRVLRRRVPGMPSRCQRYPHRTALHNAECHSNMLYAYRTQDIGSRHGNRFDQAAVVPAPVANLCEFSYGWARA
jgi:hypothetical protein